MSSVMLVSEDKELAKMVKEALRDTGARLVAVCGTTHEARDSFQQHAPSLVIVETFLPESSGLEILPALKRMNEKCLFIMLSRLRNRSMIERAFRQGAHDVFTFPLCQDSLRNTLLHRLFEESPMEEEELASSKAQTAKPAPKA